MLRSSYSQLLNVFYRSALLLCLAASLCVAQDGSNKRGFSPGNSFSIGDIETINTTNGNLMLRFPMASLPAGRNGLSAGINLYYNSKLYDSETQWFVDPNASCNMVGEDGSGILVCPYYQKSVLKESPQGGWQFGTMYSLTLLDRHDQFANVPLEKQPQCWNLNWQTYNPGYFEMRYHYKLMLNFPDGSSHEMRPNGWTDGNSNDPQGDWFDIRPDGYWYDCMNTQWYQNTITYYSVDGSFLRLDIAHDSDTDPMNNPWTLYFRDGSKVTSNQPNNESQRIYDRNNNYLELLGGEIRDQFNRSISLTNSWVDGLPVWTVTSQGFGGTLNWTIHWKWIGVLKNYWPCAQSLQCPPDVQQQEPYGYRRLAIDTITMPLQGGGLTYQFQYNAPDNASGQPLSPSLGWGEISGITLPSGARVNYTWKQDGTPTDNFTPDILRNAPTTKVLQHDLEYDGVVTPAPEETWTYDINASGGSRVTGPNGAVTTTAFVDPSAPFWNAGLNMRTIGPDGTKTETIWDRSILGASNTNPYPKTVFTSIQNAGGTYVKTGIKDYKYDKNGNVTRIAEYDWVDYGAVPRDANQTPTGLPAVSAARVTVNTYFNSTPDASQPAGSNTNIYWSSGSPRVKNALASTEIRRVLPGGTESAVSRVEYTYDNASVPANMTQVRSWDSTKGGYSSPLTSGNSLSVTTQYNQYGMPTLITDPRGLQTHMSYGSIGGFIDLYPTQVKTAYQTAQERTVTSEYNLATGLVTRTTDVDNNVSTVTTFDALGRPTLVTNAEGKPEETRTAYEYSDSLRRVITRSDLTTSGDGKLVSIQHYDQLGRVRLSRQLEDASTQSATDETKGIKVQMRYRFSEPNSYVLVSSPYRADTSSAASGDTTMGWTRSKTDNAGRVVEVQTFGGSSLPAPWGSNTTTTGTVTTAYDANISTVSDQAQKQRRSVVDGLGRLIRVDEPNASGALDDPGSPNQPTYYTYDVLGNLTKVTQSDGTTTQQRDFVYSSLSRLTQASNPESGTITYQYDEGGNLIVRTDARTVSTHYSYDALSRVTRRWYNGSSSVVATTQESNLPGQASTTDEVKFYYDAQPLPSGTPSSYDRGVSKGRLVAQTYGSGTNGDFFTYDNLGRVTLKYQQIGTKDYKVEASYNRASAITQLKYPSERTINYTYDTAGRLNVLAGNLGGTSRTYSTGIIYSPSGAMTREQFGTDTAIYNKLFYNSRGQLAEMRASTSVDPIDSADRGAIVNYYSANCPTGVCSGSSMTDNNGNLRRQEIHIPGYVMRYQEYSYDSLNRLEQAREVIDGGAEQWKQKFIYDRWGNRRIDTAVTYGVGINNKAFDVNPINNQLQVPSQQPGLMEYDAAGNLKNDTYTGAGNRTYDAENKITSALGGNNQAQLYGYDGSGQRIKRTVDGVETWQVYGLGGELLAEYPLNGATGSPQKEYGYRNGQLLITAEPSGEPPVNVALASNGASATASSAYSGFAASGAINGDRKGLFVWQNGYWSTASAGFPAWLEVQFNGSKTITEIDVVTSQDNYNAPIEPTESTTFTAGGLTAYQVQYWNGSAWVTVTGGSVSGNNKVWKKFSFAAVTTTRIRVLSSASPDNYSRLTEVEAWTGPSPAPRYNLALGATATASSNWSGWPPSSCVNGDRKSLNAGTNGAWVDAAPANTFPDWLQLDFGANKTINEVDVFTLQDNYAGSSEPTLSMTFTQWGLTAYTVEYWTGSSWIQIPDASVTGNNKIWRKFEFSPISTSKIRVVTSASVDGYSRLTEVEAYGPADTGGSGTGVQWLVTDQLGTPRMIFDETGHLENMTRHDYLPFGEELVPPTGGRSAAQGYSGGDDVRQQFTSKERDVETGLDYFQARYYASTQGRFTSIDPLLSSAGMADPQSWNRYSYVLNNPLKLIDPDGLYVFDSSVDPEQRKKFNEALTQARANLQEIAKAYGTNSEEYKKAERALSVYGAEGVKNGVTIFASAGAGNPYTQVEGVAGPKTADNPTGQNIRVTFTAKSFEHTEVLAGSIGHEGSHAADGAAWVKSGFAASSNPKLYQAEMDAFTAQSLVGQSFTPNSEATISMPYFKEPGKNPYLPEKIELWNPGWAEADRATLRRTNIDKILSRPEKAGGYGLTPASTKREFLRGGRFRR
jgi:RHS repeat-associated protein